MAKLLLEQLDEDLITVSMTVKALKLNPMNIMFVPDKIMSEDIVGYAVKLDPRVLGFVKKQYLTNKVITDALNRNGENIQHVPIQMLTINHCKAALINRKSAWLYIPKKIINKELSDIYKTPHVYCGIDD